MGQHGHSGKLRWFTAAALALSVGHACAAEAPAVGQTVTEWKEAVSAHLIADGKKMGFSVDPCPLNPPFVAGTKTYLSRAFSKDETMELTLVAVYGVVLWYLGARWMREIGRRIEVRPA